MNQNNKWEWTDSVAVLILCGIAGFLVVGLSAAIHNPKGGMGSGDTAGWVQAIGSIVGLAVVIGITRYQQIMTARFNDREKLEREDRLLRSIRIEADVLLTGFKATMGLERIPETRPILENYLFFPDAPFVVYNAVAGNLLDVRDDAKRRLIIDTYAKAQGVLVLIRMNNQILKERDDYIRSSVRNPLIDGEYTNRLRHCANQFWSRLGETMQRVEEINNTFPS